MKKFLFSLLCFTVALLSGDGFAAETLIKTLDGYSPIEKIEVGQIIQSFDCKNNKITTKPVIAKHHYKAKNYLVIKLEHEEIICSRNQKFYLHALDRWIKPKELLHDNKVKDCFCQEFAVLNITKIEEPKELYTFTINSHHNFFITESNILAHNFVPAITIPLITISAGKGVILFGGLGAAGIAGVAYRSTIREIVKGVVKSFNGESITETGRAPGMPTEKDGYKPPKKWDGKKIKVPGSNQYGWPDKKGNIWVPSGEKGHGAHTGMFNIQMENTQTYYLVVKKDEKSKKKQISL